MAKNLPAYSGTLRSHILNVPESVYKCGGILIFGRRIKSLVFSTDVAIIKNINADGVIAVYPFTPQPIISQAIITVSDAPVFVGVGGGLTGGERAVRLAENAESQGALRRGSKRAYRPIHYNHDKAAGGASGYSNHRFGQAGYRRTHCRGCGYIKRCGVGKNA